MIHPAVVNYKVRDRFKRLLEYGPFYGYWAEPSRSIIIVKEDHVPSGKNVFADLSINAVLADRFFGDYIGNGEDTRRLLRSKTTKWIEAVECLSHSAVSYPQSAYAAFTHSLSRIMTEFSAES